MLPECAFDRLEAIHGERNPASGRTLAPHVLHKAEVGQFEFVIPPRDEDILRLQVPMEQTVIVRVVHRSGQCHHDMKRDVRDERNHRRNALGQRNSGNVLHHEKRPIVIDSELEDPGDVAMAEPLGQIPFALEAPPVLRKASHMGKDHLDRILMTVPLPQEHLGHSTAPEATYEATSPDPQRWRVPIGQGQSLDGGRCILHGSIAGPERRTPNGQTARAPRDLAQRPSLLVADHAGSCERGEEHPIE